MFVVLKNNHTQYVKTCLHKRMRPQKKRQNPNSVACGLIPAEREGFEPPVQLPVHRISSAARSTTPASLRFLARHSLHFGVARVLRCKDRKIFVTTTFFVKKNKVFLKKLYSSAHYLYLCILDGILFYCHCTLYY